MSRLPARLRKAVLLFCLPTFVAKQAVALVRVEACFVCPASMMGRLFVLVGMAVGVSSVFAASFSPDNPSVWTLRAATQRLVEIAPERRQLDAVVEARLQALKQAGEWPNPSLELRADNRIGQMHGGGMSFAQSSLSQPLPWHRIAHQQAVAELSLLASQSARRAQLLLLEREAARVFHALQLAEEKLRLARQQMELTERYAQGRLNGSGDRLVRYLTPIERQRLIIMRVAAKDRVMAAELEHKQAQIEFRHLLGLAGAAANEIKTAPMTLSAVPTRAELERDLDNHPAIRAAYLEAEAARKGIEVAASQRHADPVLKLFRDRDFNGTVFDVTGIGISFELPIWSQSRALVGKAVAEATSSAMHYEALRRDTRIRLAQAYEQLIHLRKEIEHLQKNLIAPAHRIVKLTQRSFASGESSVLDLVDANATYFEARSRYLDLLNKYALAAADLRLAAGKSILLGEDF